MPITYNVEQDALYKMGMACGEARGIEQRNTTFITNLLKNYPTWSNEEIASIIGADIEKVIKLRNDFKPPRTKKPRKPKI
jgi:hypothetical protein